MWTTDLFISAVQFDFYDRLVELVNADPSVATTPDVEGVTLLHWAALNNRLQIAKYLIDRGAVIDAIGGILQTTPLYWAIREGKIDMIIFLLSLDAKFSLVDADGTLIV
jgi:palmitoyltransferase ZDHHC13/17